MSSGQFLSDSSSGKRKESDKSPDIGTYRSQLPIKKYKQTYSLELLRTGCIILTMKNCVFYGFVNVTQARYLDI